MDKKAATYEKQNIEQAVTEVLEIPTISLEIKEAHEPSKKSTSSRVMIINNIISYSLIFFVYLEILFHFVRCKGFSGVGYKCLFGAFYGLAAGFIISLLGNRAGKIVSYIIAFVVCGYFIAQVIYSGVFSTYLSLMGTKNVAGQALDFTDVIFKEVKAELVVLIFLLAPFLAYVFYFRKRVIIKSLKLSGNVIVALSLPIIYILSVATLKLDKDSDYTAYEVYDKYTSVDMAVTKLGVMESLFVDIRFAAFEDLGISNSDVEFVEENASLDPSINAGVFARVGGSFKAEKEGMTLAQLADDSNYVDTSPNVFDIDLEKLAQNEPNENIAAMHRYVNSCEPTNKNEYTGMFENYNLIFIVAEGFSGFVIDPKRTPTLYKMSTKGFCFNHYYTPLWYGSTLGGEYADLTGLMPKNGSYLSMGRAGSRRNDMMFTLSRQLLKKGYTVTGFHNNDYKYYDRHISHPNMGYNWIGVGNGLESEKSAGGVAYWPQSDLYMIENTFDMYKDSEPFHTYYLTVSGHVMYNFGGNAMAARHKDMVESLNYSEATKAYIACQYELELALTRLNEKLEEAGIADRTLIVLTADHVPYDNKEVVDELAGRSLDGTFEWYQNKLIIYSASMEEPVDVGKYCSSLDILPTVSNLMGLDYDSRMLVGQDILSDNEGFVMFNDRSFITDRCMYNANTKEVKSIAGAVIDDAYVESKIAQLKNKFSFAENVCSLDYYKYIDAAMYGDEGQ